MDKMDKFTVDSTLYSEFSSKSIPLTPAESLAMSEVIQCAQARQEMMTHFVHAHGQIIKASMESSDRLWDGIRARTGHPVLSCVRLWNGSAVETLMLTREDMNDLEERRVAITEPVAR